MTDKADPKGMSAELRKKCEKYVEAVRENGSDFAISGLFVELWSAFVDAEHSLAAAQQESQRVIRELNATVDEFRRDLIAAREQEKVLVLQLRRYKAHHSLLMQMQDNGKPCNCELCKQAESALRETAE